LQGKQSETREETEKNLETITLQWKELQASYDELAAQHEQVTAVNDKLRETLREERRKSQVLEASEATTFEVLKQENQQLKLEIEHLRESTPQEVILPLLLTRSNSPKNGNSSERTSTNCCRRTKSKPINSTKRKLKRRGFVESSVSL